MVQMRTQLENLQVKKNNLKNNLTNIKNNYLKIIYGGLCKGKNYREIHKELYKMTINSKVYSENLYKRAIKTLKVASKKMPKTETAVIVASKGKSIAGTTTIEGLRGLVAFEILHKMKSSQEMEQEIYKDTTKLDSEEKEAIIKDMIDESREKTTPIIFYLSSQHNDSALDHEYYQAMIFVDEKWESLIKDKEEKSRIRNYIKQKNIRTLQWVMGRPVWLVTRPNCRHYFKPIPTNEVIGGNVKKLVRKYKMHRKVGDRKYLQTIRHATNKKWYEDVENAKSVLNKYRERLKMHTILYKEQPNDLLKNAIEKDKMLINKWQEYLQTRI